MKKKLATIVTALTLAAIMLFGLCACGSSWGKVKSAFEKEGYKEEQTDDISEAQKALVKTFLGEDADSSVTIHVMSKKGDGLLDTLTFAIVLEFSSNEKMEEALKDKVSKEDVKDVYEELQKLDIVSGNCVFVGPAGLDIFKGTK